MTTDKAQVIDHVSKGFAYAKQAIEAIDPATLVGKLKVFGQERSAAEAVLFVAGDMHEHLGQLMHSRFAAEGRRLRHSASPATAPGRRVSTRWPASSGT